MGTLKLKNRLVHSATWEEMATQDGIITEEIIARYVNLARGEVGLIIPGHMFVQSGGKAHRKQIEICRFKPLYNLSAAETIKPVLADVPMILVGGVRQLPEMEALLEDQKADFLSMSRPFIREPFLARRLRTGKSDAAACVSCNKCFAAVYNGLPLRCYVSGETGTTVRL